MAAKFCVLVFGFWVGRDWLTYFVCLFFLSVFGLYFLFLFADKLCLIYKWKTVIADFSFSLPMLVGKKVSIVYEQTFNFEEKFCTILIYFINMLLIIFILKSFKRKNLGWLYN